MQEYDFLLMYEHKVRELDNLCLLKYELDKRGYRTKILYVNDYELVKSHAVAYKTRVLVVGYCYTSSSIKEVYWWNNLLCNLFLFLYKSSKFIMGKFLIRFHCKWYGIHRKRRLWRGNTQKRLRFPSRRRAKTALHGM